LHSIGQGFDSLTLQFSVAQTVEQMTVNYLVKVQFLAEKMLKILYLIPVIGLVIIPFIRKEIVFKFSLWITILSLIYSVYLTIVMDNSISLQYIDTLLNITIGVDGISMVFILLTAGLMPITILVSRDSIKQELKPYYFSLISIELLLFGVFSIFDLIGFYIAYEAILIPMIIIIGVYGARKEKITAAYYFFFYTLVGSIAMLMSIIYIYYTYGTTDYIELLTKDIPSSIQIFLFIGFFLSFAAKIPQFPFHIWLPLAHVEAPLAGSILLAGVLIKMGSYGLMRFALPLLPDASLYFAPLVNTLAVLAVIYASLTTMRQTDLKRIIAYSSVGHMGVVMLGLFSFTIIGLEGSILLQISHGLVSSALFIIVTLIYERHHSRIVKYYRGLAITMPIFALFFLILTLANIGVPLSLNFIGEFLSLYGIFKASFFLGILGSLGMVLSAGYALFLLNRVLYANQSPYVHSSPLNRDLSRKEFSILFPLVLLTILLGIFPDFLLSKIHLSSLLILTP
jgi:proton-translocating NADH-quinone oxidoreductase chain M